MWFMRFLLGNGMYLMTAIMRMYSLPIPTVCGGIGVLTIPGDGVHHGTIAVGIMALAICMAVIGEVGIRIIIIGIRDITITITRIMHGVV
jgi:hypothetical protein